VAGPGIYILGELGIRHEDAVAVTQNVCENLARSGRGRLRKRRWCEREGGDDL
jgi:Xaa-Pro aminopeptidase